MFTFLSEANIETIPEISIRPCLFINQISPEKNIRETPICWLTKGLVFPLASPELQTHCQSRTLRGCLLVARQPM